MHITELIVSNVKRISAVTIKPDGSTIVIGGKNGAGKSSVLDSIFWVLAGTKGIPSQPIRNGAESGSIKIKLEGDRNLIVTRKFQKGGKTALELAQVDDAGRKLKVMSPQKVLDELYSAIAFDPLAFTRLPPTKQAELLQEVMGVVLDDLDDEYDTIFATRTEINRAIKTSQAFFDTLILHDDVPEEEVLVAELMEELEAAQLHNDKVSQLRALSIAASTRSDNAVHVLDEARRVLAVAKDDLAESEALLTQCKLSSKKAHEDYKAVPETECDEIRQRITDSEQLNRKVRSNIERALASQGILDQQGLAGEATEKLSSLKEQRLKRLSEVTWPVNGLSFGKDGVTYNGLPFEQCSSAEQLRISTAIGLARNPELKVMLIHDGSLLDESSLADIKRMADEANAQVWIERVSEGEECSVIIEDGAVVGGAVQDTELATA